VLKLLLDEHISPSVAEGLRKRHKSITVYSMTEWQGGRFLGVPDDALLEEAAAQKLTLVTSDRKTIPPMLKTWAEVGHDHGGVIFVDERTIVSSEFGGLIRAIQAIAKEFAKADWTNQVFFLRRV
jgi:hypothetical protein